MKNLLTKIISHFQECEVKERIVCASVWILGIGLCLYCFFVVMHYIFSTFMLYMDVYGIPIDGTGGWIFRELMW